MTIASAITNAQNKIAAAYTALSDKGATLPATQNLSNMLSCIDSIQSTFNIANFDINNAIRIENGVMYAVYDSSIIDTKYNVVFTPEQWEKELIIQFHIKTPSTLSGQWIMSNGSSWDTGIGLTINSDINNAFWFIFGQTDTSKDITLNGITIPQTDTEYWVRIYKPNTENLSAPTELQISTDGINWTTESSVSIPNVTSNYVTDGVITLFNSKSGQPNKYSGGIYFDKDTFISINGEKIWYLID